jgi:hypothetical protein
VLFYFRVELKDARPPQEAPDEEASKVRTALEVFFDGTAQVADDRWLAIGSPQDAPTWTRVELMRGEIETMLRGAVRLHAGWAVHPDDANDPLNLIEVARQRLEEGPTSRKPRSDKDE